MMNCVYFVPPHAISCYVQEDCVIFASLAMRNSVASAITVISQNLQSFKETKNVFLYFEKSQLTMEIQI